MKMLFIVFSINRFPNLPTKLARKQIMPILTLLVFIFHDGNRAHFSQISVGFPQIVLHSNKRSLWYLLRTYVESVEETG